MAIIGIARDFNQSLVICNFDKDPIKTEHVRLETTFSILYAYGKVLRHSRASNSAVDRIWQEVEGIRDFMPVLVTCNFYEDPIKSEWIILSTFSILL